MGVSFRLRRTLFLFSLSLLALGAHADLVVIQDVESGSSRGEMTIQIKGSKIRADLAEPVSILFDSATGETVYLRHPRKTFSRLTAAQSKELGDKLRQNAPPTGAGKLEATPQKRDINGWATELFHWSIGPLKMNFWVARDFPNGAAVQEQLDRLQASGPGQATAALMPPRSVLPWVRVRTELEAGGRKLAYTITSVKEQPVPDAVFTVPGGYRETPFDVSGEEPSREP